MCNRLLFVVVALSLSGRSAGAAPPAAIAASAAGPSSSLTLDRIYSDPPLEGRAPAAVTLSPAGGWLTWLQPSVDDSDVLDLWGQRLPDGAPMALVTTKDLLQGGVQRLTEQEKMALERKRISKRGITDYQWCGDDDGALLFPLSGDLYRVAPGAPGTTPKVLRLTRDEDTPELSPACSHDGARIAWVKGGDVVVHDVKKGASKAVTKGGRETRTFGLAEFIAEEEMDRHEGFWWSPDGASLLVLEVDESRVGIKTRAQIFADRTELVQQRYPAAGENNARVTPWLVDVKTAKMTRVDVPREGEYIARAGFFPDGVPWIQWQTRDQKKLVLASVTTSGKDAGKLVPILDERDDAWVDLHDDLRALPDGRLLWSSEASGRRQLVVVDRKSGARAALTDQPEKVIGVVGMDAKAGQVFFLRAVDRGREQQLFSVSLADRSVKQVTTEPGWHNVVFDDTGRFFVDTSSSWGHPPRVRLCDASGRVLKVLDDNPAAELQAFPTSAPQWLDLKADDGSALNAMLLQPLGLRGGQKAPLLTWIYGGPMGHLVARRWMRQSSIFTHWVERGYGVLVVDNRGMGQRDRAFARAIGGHFGDVEVKDVFGAVRQVIAQQPWIDASRVGIAGWSYGGYLAARAILDDSSPFAAAVAVAPVTDWTLYDTHYTERYLGLPTDATTKQAATTYTASNLVARAKLLHKPLLVVHGTADDNVLFEHSLRLIEALENEGALFRTQIYPGKAHGISGRPAQKHVYKTITSFFDDELHGR